MLAVALVFTAGVAQAQRASRSALHVQQRDDAIRRPVPLTGASGNRTNRFILVGTLIGGVSGYIAYRHALGPAPEDFMPFISIPMFVGGGAVVGASLGWLVSALTGPAPESAEIARAKSRRERRVVDASARSR